MAADPWVTLNPLVIDAVSVLVVRVTVRKPRFVVGKTVMFAVADVALETETELTVIPVPK